MYVSGYRRMPTTLVLSGMTVATNRINSGGRDFGLIGQSIGGVHTAPSGLRVGSAGQGFGLISNGIGGYGTALTGQSVSLTGHGVPGTGMFYPLSSSMGYHAVRFQGQGHGMSVYGVNPPAFTVGMGQVGVNLVGNEVMLGQLGNSRASSDRISRVIIAPIMNLGGQNIGRLRYGIAPGTWF